MTTIISPNGQKNNEFSQWDITKKYRVGDLVIHNQQIYETTGEVPAGTPFDITDPNSPWFLAVIAEEAQNAVNAQNAQSADEALALDAPDTAAVKIGGGTLGQVLKSLGDGTTEWGDVAGGTASLPIANGTSNIDIATTNGNITFGVSGNANIVTITGEGANVTGYLTVTGNITGNLVGNTSQQTLLSSVTGEPTGFPDPSRTQTTLAFTDASRTVTIAPTGANFSVWVSGVEYIKSAAETVVIPNATQLNYISYSNTGTLQTTTTFFDLEHVAPVAYVYYNTTTGTQEFFADERHGTTMDWRTHQYLHTTRGAAIATGFVGSIPVNTTGAADANAQIGISSGVFYDEDLQISVTATTTPTVNTFQQDLASPAKIPVFYRSGTAWVQDPVTSFPFKAGTARPTYNLNTGGNWTTPDITNNKYGVMFIVATNNLNYPVLSIMGQDEYASLGAAQAATYNSLDLVGMPVAEIRPLYMVIFKTANGMSNALKAAIQTYVDIRRELAVQAGSNSLTPPAGSNTEVQFNDGGVFGASPTFTFVADTDTVTVQHLAVTGEINTSLVPSANVTYDLGSAALRWNDLYLSNNTIYMGDQTISAASGNIEFSGGITTGSVALPNGGIIEESSISGTVSATTIALKPAGGSDADQQLLVYPTAAGDLNHLHLTSGNLFNTELFLGNDDFYVKLANTGNIVVNTNDNTGNSAQWTFAADKTMTMPESGSIIGEEMTLVGIGNINFEVAGSQQWAFSTNGALIAANTTAEFLGTSDQEITLRAGGLNIGTIDNLVAGGAVNDFAFVAGNAAAGDSPAAGGAVTITTGRGGEGLNGNGGGAGGAFIVSTGLGGTCEAGSSPGASGEIILTTTDSLPAVGVPGVTSGPITITTGNGGDSDTTEAGTSGEIIIGTGNGGTGGTDAWSGESGKVTIKTGDGGSIPTNDRGAETAGVIELTTGRGGDGRNGGRGGAIELVSGDGGAGTTDNGGAGGDIDIISGTGGTTNDATPGNGGLISIIAGDGGSTTTSSGGSADGVEVETGNGGEGSTGGGSGGLFKVTTGAGGPTAQGGGGTGGGIELETGSGADSGSAGDGGNAGNMTITLGNGGEASDGNGGTGGSFTLTVGNGGSGSSSNGTNGSITMTTQAGSFVIDPTGQVTLPLVNGAQTAFKGTRTMVFGDFVYPTPNTPTVVFAAAAKSLKMSFTVTHTTNTNDLETEFFDVVVARGTTTIFSVSNRLNTFGSGVGGVNDTVVTVDINGTSNEIEVSLTTKIGTAAAVAYSVTEFKN